MFLIALIKAKFTTRDFKGNPSIRIHRLRCSPCIELAMNIVNLKVLSYKMTSGALITNMVQL